MKWGRSSKSSPKNKPWQTSGSGGDDDKPWKKNTATPSSESVAHILGALSFTEERTLNNETPEKTKGATASSSEDPTETECTLETTETEAEDHTASEHHEGSDDEEVVPNTEAIAAAATATTSTGDPAVAPGKPTVDAPSATADKEEEAGGGVSSANDDDQPTQEQSHPLTISPSGSGYYSAMEDLLPTPAKESPDKSVEEDAPDSLQHPILELVDSKDSVDTIPMMIDSQLTPTSPVQDKVKYFTEEGFKKELSPPRIDAAAALIAQGVVKEKVETVELTETQIAAKKVAHMAAAAANRKNAERQHQEERRAREAAAAAGQAPTVEDEEERRRAERLQSELEAGRQRALAALAKAKQRQQQRQPEQQQPQQHQQSNEKVSPVNVNATVLMSGVAPSLPVDSEDDNDAVSETNPTSTTAEAGRASPVMSELSEVVPEQAAQIKPRLSFDQMSVQSDAVSQFSTDSLGYNSSGTPSNNNSGLSPRKRVSEIIRRDLWSKDGAVVEAALAELAEKAASAQSYRNGIARTGGILAIVRAMEQNIDSDKIQVVACRALEKLALDTVNELAIGEVGGVDAILGAMMAHFTNEPVQEAAWSALWNCTCGNACDTMTIDTQGGMAAIVSCMKQHADNAIVQTNACGSLTNLCLDNDVRLEALVAADGFVAIAGALQRHWSNPVVRNEASHAMTSLLEKHEQAYSEVNDETETSVIDEVVIEEEEEFEEEIVEEY